MRRAYPRQLVAETGADFDRLEKEHFGQPTYWHSVLDLDKLTATTVESIDERFVALRFPIGELVQRICSLRAAAKALAGKGSAEESIWKLTANAMYGVLASPGTFMRWLRDERKAKPTKRGRPRTFEDLRKLILRMAKENDWGYTRIMGELKKLGITPPSRNTVKNILKGAGLEPGPKRGQNTWDEFLSRHAATLVQCDFLHKRIWTARGLRDVFVLVFLHVGTRKAFVSPVSTEPNEAWVRQQMKDYLQHAKAENLPVKMLFHDNDSKFTKIVDRDLKDQKIDVCKTAFRAPNTNAFVERFIQSIQHECLDHFIILGERHFDFLASEWLEHYHTERPHQAKENELLTAGQSNTGTAKVARRGSSAKTDVAIECRERLGGLLKHYHCRKAA